MNAKVREGNRSAADPAVNSGRTASELHKPTLRPYVSTLRDIGACAVRRLTAGVAVVLALVLAGCGGSDDDKKTTTSSSRPGTSTTTDSTATTATTAPAATTAAGSATTAATTATTAATDGSPSDTTASTARPAASVVVTLYAQKGEIPPGETQPLEAPAWKATGVGWDPGHVDMIVKRTDGPSVVLDVGAEADGDSRFERIFVVLEVEPGTYAAIASQGGKQAQGSFAL